MTAETRRHVDAEPGLAPRRLIFGARVAVDDPYSTLPAQMVRMVAEIRLIGVFNDGMTLELLFMWLCAGTARLRCSRHACSSVQTLSFWNENL